MSLLAKTAFTVFAKKARSVYKRLPANRMRKGKMFDFLQLRLYIVH